MNGFPKAKSRERTIRTARALDKIVASGILMMPHKVLNNLACAG